MTLVIIPTYNERDNLPALVKALMRLGGVEVMVVDDQSPDGTGEIADGLAAASGGRVHVLHRTGLRGIGRSYIEAMQQAVHSEAELVCQMDADFSHDPTELPRLLEAAKRADLVIGSRYVPGGTLRNWPRRRMALSAFANYYVRAITRLPIRDCTAGFRCWRRDLLARLPLDRVVSDGYAFQVEMAWLAHRAGARIAEVPITFVERRLGTSKMSGGVIFESAILPWRLVAQPRTPPR